MFNIMNLGFVKVSIKDKEAVKKFVESMYNEYMDSKAWGVPVDSFTIPGGFNIESFVGRDLDRYEEWLNIQTENDRWVVLVEDNTENNDVIGILGMNINPVENQSDFELSVLFDYRREGIGSHIFNYAMGSLVTHLKWYHKERDIVLYCPEVDLQAKYFIEHQSNAKCVDRVKGIGKYDTFKYIVTMLDVDDTECEVENDLSLQRYEYISVRQKMNWNVISKDYFDVIKEYAEKGWRFICIVPVMQRSDGLLNEFDLVFEREVIKYG